MKKYLFCFYYLCFKATPHNHCRADAKSDFSSDCIETTQAYWRKSRSFCAIWRKICKQMCGKGASRWLCGVALTFSRREPFDEENYDPSVIGYEWDKKIKLKQGYGICHIPVKIYTVMFYFLQTESDTNCSNSLSFPKVVHDFPILQLFLRQLQRFYLRPW